MQVRKYKQLNGKKNLDKIIHITYIIVSRRVIFLIKINKKMLNKLTYFLGPAVKSCAMKYLMAEKQPSYKELDDDSLQEFISPQNNISILGCFKRNSKLRTAFTDVAKDLKHVYNFGIVKQFELDKKNYEDDIILFRPTYLTNKYEKDYIVYEGGSGTDEINRYISKNKHGLVKVLRNDIYHVITYPMTIVYFDVDLHNPHGLSYCRTQVLRVAKQFYNRMNFAISEKLNADEDVTYPHVVMKFDDNEVFVMKQFFSSQNLENFVTGMLKMMEEWEKHPDRSMSEWQMNV